MIEILFKAKNREGNWVEGLPFYSHGCGECKISHSNGWIPSYSNPDEGESTLLTNINPKTICQFIGLTDKKDKNIFEGHIVRGSYGVKHGNYGQQKDVQFTGVVKYGFGQYYIKIGETKAGVNRCVYFSKLWPLSPTSVEIEIIGNIFDNPELLK